jgi:hypothetical protein
MFWSSPLLRFRRLRGAQDVEFLRVETRGDGPNNLRISTHPVRRHVYANEIGSGVLIAEAYFDGTGRRIYYAGHGVEEITVFEYWFGADGQCSLRHRWEPFK